MKKLVAEKDKNATVLCTLESYNGTVTPSLTIVATHGATVKSGTGQGRNLTLNIDSVPGNMVTKCSATVGGNSLSYTDEITTYSKMIEGEGKIYGVRETNRRK